MTESVSTQSSARTFSAESASIGAARRFVRGEVAEVLADRGAELRGDVELAVSELVTNAVQYGLDQPVSVIVSVSSTEVVVSVRSARTSSEIADPSTWAGPLPAMRTGRGLAIVRSISDEVAVEADDTSVTVHCTFRLG